MKNRGYIEKKFEVQLKAKENDEIRLSVILNYRVVKIKTKKRRETTPNSWHFV